MSGFPLTLTHVLRRMGDTHAEHEVVGQLDATGATATATFAEIAVRAAKLAAGLRALGVEPGDRVGSFAWNSSEHLEAY
jgi:fatty-acyl-CoA synthase